MHSYRHANAHYALIQCLYWMPFSAYYTYGAPYLYSLGLTSGRVGLVIALTGLMSALLQPVLASAADRSRTFTVRRLAVLLAAAACACLTGVWFTAAIGARLWRIALYAAAWMLLISLQFLVSACGMEYAAAGIPLNFGAGRACGSLGYAVVTYALGFATARFGMDLVLPFAAACCLFLLLLLLLWKPAPREISVESAMETATRGSAGGFFARYPRFLLFIIGCFIIMIAYCMCCNFLVRIVENLGGGTVELGTAVTITALCEIPTIFLSDRLRKRFGSGRLMKFTAVMLAVKVLLIALSQSIGFLYLAMVSQLISYSLFVPVSVFYADGRMRAGDKVRGQAMMTLVTTVGSAAGSLFGGWLLDTVDLPGMLLFCMICAAVGAAIMIAGTEKVA